MGVEVDGEEVLGDLELVGDHGEVVAVEAAPGVEGVRVDEQLGGVLVGSALLPSVVASVTGRLITVSGVPQLVSESGPVFGDAQSASGADRAGGVPVVAFRPVVVADQSDTQPFCQAG